MSDQGVDQRRRRFLTATTSVVGGIGVVFVAAPFVQSWWPSARAKAIGAPIEIDVSKLEPGQRLIETWRRQPVWVLRRSEEQLASLETLEPKLRDPASEVPTQQPSYCQNLHRSIKPEYFLCIGICTHLGCSPLYVEEEEAAEWALGAEWEGGFFCPCHGSRFDLAGRVYQGVPAPTNLVVPPHRYVSERVIEVGVDPEEAA